MERPDPNIWCFEGILLEPGMRLRMCPQTPHWVVTVKPSICRGGHFYCFSTLGETVIGLYRTWALGGVITNTNHDPSRLLLIRIMYLWHRHFVLEEKVTGYLSNHIPNLECFDDILVVFTLAIAMELLNVVDYQTYRVETNLSDHNSELQAEPGLPSLLLLQYVDARAKSPQLLHFFFSNFEFIDDSDVAIDGPKEIYYPFFAQHAAALFSMKKKGYNQGIRGARDCTMLKFDHELQLAIAGSTYFKEAMVQLKQEPDTFEWSDGKYTIRRLSTPIPCSADWWLPLLSIT
ncbi:uncharacterized protein LACBIDRAFT_304616 [Laccaria bicolor S238N-H82]|uniref:Predicted protein n=1 Tax=Laccaria bicolor (strain S238N-H82 / ATCC MYA-4686) TaxID=486041 RepID=B0DM06_LACBS|nr:uncharacterized protein LACBIDRAFT_304616 [Laccaria bicolor S238N-H82]EDR04388.1 predicted protein [Laccaria bicolor S238N-H82]|eukprot:XP_001884907.1 predicted protein [Laccaria bicolor S238N-H82]